MLNLVGLPTGANQTSAPPPSSQPEPEPTPQDTSKTAPVDDTSSTDNDGNSTGTGAQNGGQTSAQSGASTTSAQTGGPSAGTADTSGADQPNRLLAPTADGRAAEAILTTEVDASAQTVEPLVIDADQAEADARAQAERVRQSIVQSELIASVTDTARDAGGLEALDDVAATYGDAQDSVATGQAPDIRLDLRQ